MNEKEIFFEIGALEVCSDLKANFVMVEDGGKGPAYLGWCENLAIDTPETLPTVDAGQAERPSLLLPFADLALLTKEGHPVAAPEDWQERVIRPLSIQDYLLMTLEENPAAAEVMPIPG